MQEIPNCNKQKNLWINLIFKGETEQFWPSIMQSGKTILLVTFTPVLIAFLLESVTTHKYVKYEELEGKWAAN